MIVVSWFNPSDMAVNNEGENPQAACVAERGVGALFVAWRAARDLLGVDSQ
jgi:hypothetical protein